MDWLNGLNGLIKNSSNGSNGLNGLNDDLSDGVTQSTTRSFAPTAPAGKLLMSATDTGKGVWITGKNLREFQDALKKLEVWNSFNRKKGAWLVKKEDLARVIDYFRLIGLPYESLTSDLQSQCAAADQQDESYVCNPENGRWVKRVGIDGQRVLTQYPHLVLKLPPVIAPGIDDMRNKFDDMQLDSICAFFMTHSIAKDAIKQKRSDIAREFQTKFNVQSHFSDISSEQLLQLFQMIDNEFFNRQIQDHLMQNNQHLKIIPASQTYTSELCSKDPLFPDNNCVYTIGINLQDIVDSIRVPDECVQKYGVSVCSRVELVLVMLENELAHLIGNIFCSPDERSNLLTKVKTNIFGHSPGGDTSLGATRFPGNMGNLDKYEEEPDQPIRRDLDEPELGEELEQPIRRGFEGLGEQREQSEQPIRRGFQGLGEQPTGRGLFNDLGIDSDSGDYAETATELESSLEPPLTGLRDRDLNLMQRGTREPTGLRGREPTGFLDRTSSIPSISSNPSVPTSRLPFTAVGTVGRPREQAVIAPITGVNPLRPEPSVVNNIQLISQQTNPQSQHKTTKNVWQDRPVVNNTNIDFSSPPFEEMDIDDDDDDTTMWGTQYGTGRKRKYSHKIMFRYVVGVLDRPKLKLLNKRLEELCHVYNCKLSKNKTSARFSNKTDALSFGRTIARSEYVAKVKYFRYSRRQQKSVDHITIKNQD